MKGFLKNLCLRPSCYECKFKGNPRSGDVTLGDFWGINIINPEIDDDKGTSLIFLNTKKGKEFFEIISEETFHISVSIEEAEMYNTCLFKPVQKPLLRYAFWEDINRIPFEKLALKYFKSDINLKLFSKKIMRKIIILGKLVWEELK